MVTVCTSWPGAWSSSRMLAASLGKRTPPRARVPPPKPGSPRRDEWTTTGLLAAACRRAVDRQWEHNVTSGFGRAEGTHSAAHTCLRRPHTSALHRAPEDRQPREETPIPRPPGPHLYSRAGRRERPVYHLSPPLPAQPADVRRPHQSPAAQHGTTTKFQLASAARAGVRTTNASKLPLTARPPRFKPEERTALSPAHHLLIVAQRVNVFQVHHPDWCIFSLGPPHGREEPWDLRLGFGEVHALKLRARNPEATRRPPGGGSKGRAGFLSSVNSRGYVTAR